MPSCPHTANSAFLSYGTARYLRQLVLCVRVRSYEALASKDSKQTDSNILFRVSTTLHHQHEPKDRQEVQEQTSQESPIVG